MAKVSPYGKPGELRYLREPLVMEHCADEPIAYYADDKKPVFHEGNPVAWRWERNSLPQIHFPKIYARSFVRITEIRVERLQDISPSEAKAEGVGFMREIPDADETLKDLDLFGILWESIHGSKALGIARIISTKQRALGRGDGEISIDGDWWNDAPEAKRRALLDHELQHLTVKRTRAGVTETDDQGRPKLMMRDHDYQFGWFSIIAARHGENSIECQQAKQILDGSGEWLFPKDVMQKLISR